MKRDAPSRMMTASRAGVDRPVTSYTAAGFSRNLGKDPKEVESNYFIP
jgi:hypothetical protein